MGVNAVKYIDQIRVARTDYAQDQPVLESSSNGTIRGSLTLSQSTSGWGVNFDDEEVVRGEITIWVSDAKGKKFYEETIELVKQP